MENLMPPPNGSPEEIQAWNDMMDTMVTFIKASTHLMNTITQKVRSTSSRPLGPGPTLADIMGGCEPECEACRPKPPCGICCSDGSGAAPPPPAKKSSSSKSPVVKSPSAAEPTPEAAEEGGEAAEGGEPPEGDAPAAEGEEAAAEEGGEEAAAADAPVEEEKLPSASPSADQSPAPQAAPAAGGKKQCTCAAIRAKRQQQEQLDSCACPRSKKKNPGVANNVIEEVEEEEPEPPKEEPPEHVCACGPTKGNTEATMREMMEKLENTQKEINQLQEEMARLQRMDASKRTGPHAGPNPAALYKEIMRDNEPLSPSQRMGPQVRQRLFQTNTTDDTADSDFTTPPNRGCFPCDESSRASGSYGGGSPGINSGQQRPMMRPPMMSQAISAQSMGGRPNAPPYYPGVQAPCGRSNSRTNNPMMPPSSPDPNYWSRLGEYGSPAPPMQRQQQMQQMQPMQPMQQMIVCPSRSAPPPQEPPPPRRRIVCGPPPRAPSGSDEMSSTEITKRIQDVSKKLENKYKEVKALEEQKSQLISKAPVPPCPRQAYINLTGNSTGYSGSMSYSAGGSSWPTNGASNGGSQRRRGSSGSPCPPTCQ